MAIQKVTGTYNFTNPGVTDNNKILEAYKQYVNPEKTWTLASDEEHEAYKAIRPNHELNVDKLVALFPGQIPHIDEAIANLMKRLAANKA